jgi:hypothetical protein
VQPAEQPHAENDYQGDGRPPTCSPIYPSHYGGHMSDDGRFFLNDHSHYSFQFSPTHPEAANIMSPAQVFIQVSQVFFPSLLQCRSARNSPTISSIGTPTQLPRSPLSPFSSNSDLHAHLLFTSGAKPAMLQVLKLDSRP